jgi:hypothetical protein
VGYIVSDPQTGSGAYRISGGSNGGSLTFTANAGGIIGLLVFTGLGMLTPIAKELFPFKGDCGEEDIVKQLVLAAILIALIMGGYDDYADKGTHVIEFEIADGVHLLRGTQPNEWLHMGSMRLGRQIKEVLYHGVNPY